MDTGGNSTDVPNESIDIRNRSIDEPSRSKSICTASGSTSFASNEIDGTKDVSVLKTMQIPKSRSDSCEDVKTAPERTNRVPSPVRDAEKSSSLSFPSSIQINQDGEQMVCQLSKTNARVMLPVQHSLPHLVHPVHPPIAGPYRSECVKGELSKAAKKIDTGKPPSLSTKHGKKPLPTTVATRPKSKTTKTKTQLSLGINLVPETRFVLSDYNYILSQNIELFEVSTSYDTTSESSSVGSTTNDLPKTKIGLRCIYCYSNERHVTAASFFPSSTASISSGMGTIGSRHFIGGKCPSFPKEILERLIAAKKTSQQQTRSQGKLGLDAYCKKLAKSQNIFDHEVGGIFVAKKSSSGEQASASTTLSLSAQESNVLKESSQESNVLKDHPKPLSANTLPSKGPDTRCVPKETIINRKDPSAFKESTLEYFWECAHCSSLPFQWRASGSIVFCATTPTIELVGKHLAICQGKKPLRIPRNASIKIRSSDNDMNKCSVLVQWDNHEDSRKSGRIKRQSIGPASAKKRKRFSLTASKTVKLGIEEESLTFPSDKPLTTDFAHFTALQLKKCYLTKAGGSRGSCPVGYPGLACNHCAGSQNERRFFYTSADHLRNSFSHIPSHLMMCSKCPPEVKAKIEEYKVIRNKQKSLLKVGDHKVFIDRVWERLHGPGLGIIEASEPDSFGEMSDNEQDADKGKDIASIDFLCDPSDDYLNESLDGRYLECKEIAIDISESTILSSSDKKLASSYVYYALLQMCPKQISIDSTGDEQTRSNSNNEKNECSSSKANNESDLATLINDRQSLQLAATVNSPNPGELELKKTTEEQVGNTKDSQTANRWEEKRYLEKNEVDNSNSCHNSNNDQREKNETYHSLVCKYCNYEGMQPKFLPTSAENLRISFAEIPKHLMSCPKCPEAIKLKLKKLKALRPIQEAMLKRGANIKLMNSVWSRLENHFVKPKAEKPALVEETPLQDDSSSNMSLVTSLLSEKDRTLVSEFTYFTMEQMEACVLKNSGNGSRSMFAFGFPGLGCKHCSDKPSARRFFYRTSEILSGNYAHIPNHVLSCKYCPIEIKQELAEKKKRHQTQKQLLRRGSQRIFFNNVWDRLHARSRKAASYDSNE